MDTFKTTRKRFAAAGIVISMIANATGWAGEPARSEAWKALGQAPILTEAGTTAESASTSLVLQAINRSVNATPQGAIAQVDFESIPSDGAYGASCDGACDAMTDCDSCGPACCTPWWAHRTGGFAELLLLRPGSSDLTYTVEQNAAAPGAFPTGPVGQVNIDEELGYRFGFTLAKNDCQSIVVSYTGFDSSTSDTINRTGANFLNSQVIHPSTATVGTNSLASSASSGIDFDLVDVALRRVLSSSNVHVLNWSAGLRYGQMEQNFTSTQDVAVATGLVTVATDVDFSGFGLELGLDGTRRDCETGLLVYSRGLASVLGGEWKTNFVQTQQVAGGTVANISEDYRMTPVLELELGIGWQNDAGNLKVTAGYMANAWYNAVTTRSYIRDFRAGKYDDFNETVTFDGLTARVEFGF